MTPARDGREPGVLRVIVLADDLIWATRLVGQLRTLGVDPVRLGSLDALAAALAGARAGVAGNGPADVGSEDARPTHVVVDLTARAYDGIAAVRLAATAGFRVLCVGQHDDQAFRRSALAAGAERVFAYRRLFENGHAVLAAWLGVPAPATGSLSVPAPGSGPSRRPPSPKVPAR